MKSQTIHMSIGGPTYAITAAKTYYFEDHSYLGPQFTDRHGNGIASPKESDSVWVRINTWYRQGKRYEEIDGIRWCKYKTDMQLAREFAKRSRETELNMPPNEPTSITQHEGAKS